MKTAKTSSILAPTKGVRPQMAGVPGALVDYAPPEVIFGAHGRRQSPYDPLLVQLRQAGAGKFLRFDDVRAHASVYARSKKLNIKVQFGEHDGKLWVSLAAVDLATNGHVEEQPLRPSNTDLLMRAIREGKRATPGEIVSWMRSNGAAGIGITQVDGLLSNLLRMGKLRIKSKRPGDEIDRYEVAA